MTKRSEQTGICANPICGRVFKQTAGRGKTKKYCCDYCRTSTNDRNYLKTHPEQKQKSLERLAAYEKQHPEIKRKRVKKAYLTGRKLPPWMFS